MAFAVIPALVLGYLDDKIEAVLGNQIDIICFSFRRCCSVCRQMVSNPTILDEKIFLSKAVTIGFGNALHDARNISICGHWRNDSRLKQKSGS
jgi:hypothetical protein